MLWVCEIRGTISRLANIRGTSIPSDEAIDYRCGTKQYNDPPTQHATREHDFILGIHIQWLCLYTVLLWPRIINFPDRHVIYCRLDFTGLCLTTCYDWLSTTCFHSTWRAVTNSNILQTNAKPTHHPIHSQLKPISRDTCIPFAFLSMSTASIQSSCSTRPISLSKVASAPTEAIKLHLKLDPTLVGVLLLLTIGICKEHWLLIRE